MGHNYIGTEHLLLGILAEDKDTGARVLRGLGITMNSPGLDRQALSELAAPGPRAAERAGRCSLTTPAAP